MSPFELLKYLSAFGVIMAGLSLLITIIAQMVSATLSLRGKNLANALALTFQTIDPRIGKYAHSLTAQILRDPIFSDSIWRRKDRPPVVSNANAQAVIKLEKELRTAEAQLAANPENTDKQSVVENTKEELIRAKAGLQIPHVKPNRMKPWGVFSKLRDATALGKAIRPGEIYRLLYEIAELTETEAALRDVPPELVRKSFDLLARLKDRDQPTKESEAKLKTIRNVAEIFTTAEQQKAVLDSLANFGATVERATTEGYDRFQRWFGSAQDRAEQWFQTHVRMVTIVAAALVSIFLQLDTVEIYDKLRHEPMLVEALMKAAPGTLEQGATVQGQADADAREKAFANLKARIDSTGFEVLPFGWFARWPTEKFWWFNHLFGLALSAGLLTLGAWFWFNLLKNLMSLRPTVATLVEKRPTSAPTTPPSPS